jgi:hypothetical protein
VSSIISPSGWFNVAFSKFDKEGAKGVFLGKRKWAQLNKSSHYYEDK